MAQLEELDSFLEGQLARYYRSGRKADSQFVKAMEELHSVLGLGLSLLISRKKCQRTKAADSRPATESKPTQQQLSSLRGKSPTTDESEYFLKYDHELSCFQRSSQVRRELLPMGFRRERMPLAGLGRSQVVKERGKIKP